MFPWWIFCKGSDLDPIEDGKAITAFMISMLAISIGAFGYVVYVSFFR